MPVIVCASSKGGAGKTTVCALLASELAKQGEAKNVGVSLIDADPEKNLSTWAGLKKLPANIKIVCDVNEDNVLDVIEQAKAESVFVIVDLEGIASTTVAFAITQADLVIIPCQASQMDANKAVKVIKVVKTSSKMIHRDIPYAVMFNRLSAAIVTKTGKALREEFVNAGIDVFDRSLMERESFKSIFSFGGTIYDLPTKNAREVQSLTKAADNVKLLTEEVKRRLIEGTKNAK